ncbi:MAG: hypothetical protein GY810_02580 [Aureispira sp.]|nr:hypothetical protein [Aureispira sp.]
MIIDDLFDDPDFEKELNDDGGEDDFMKGLFDDEEDAKGLGMNEAGGLLDGMFGSSEPILPFKREKRPARLDITKNSKSNHRNVQRYTKKEMAEQLKKDHRYMKGKRYMMIQPFAMMADYFYKKKKSDEDAIRDDLKNVEFDYVFVIGRLPKWKSTEEFKGKAYVIGECMFVRKGIYDVDGERKLLLPHFALVVKKKYKVIKTKRIRDVLAPLKQRLRTGKPYGIYKEFPKLVERAK